MMRVADSKRPLAALAVMSMALVSLYWFGWLGKDQEHLVSSPPGMKRILYWGYYFGKSWKEAGDWPLGIMSCPGGVACFFTDNQHDYVSSDAVFFHGSYTTLLTKLPAASIRPSKQVWILFTAEPPTNILRFYPEKNIINWTATFLGKSDVRVYYGKILPGRFNGGFNSSRNYLEGKTRSVVAVISNCRPDRLSLVNELSKFIDVDVFGRCGKEELCEDCWENLQHYKFYLSFENTICVDYVTEKFYKNGLKYGMVPVVLGGANYSDPSVAPPGSYINVKDFESMQELAKFLKKVGSDPQIYNRYFQWYSHYEVAGPSRGECELCALLHQNTTIKVYEDVMEWYRTEAHCEAYPDVPHT